jgi:hypothetical protein
VVVARLAVVVALGLALVACSGDDGTGVVGPVDEELSARLLPVYADCLGLDVGSVTLEVDADGEHVRSGWSVPAGSEPSFGASRQCLGDIGVQVLSDG